MRDIGYCVRIEEWIDVVLSLKEAGLSAAVMAHALGRKTTWIDALLSIARDPVARALLNAERLSSVGAWEQFMALSPAVRKRLLESDEPISRARCERAARERRRILPQGFSA